MKEQYNSIILGLGAMGSASVYQLAKRGARVLGIDQFSPPHIMGSTHGDTRITRQAIGEGTHYTPISLRSYELFREIERETGADLLTITGGLMISSPAAASIHVAGFFENTLSAARKFNIKHDVLNASQIRSRFPQFKVQDNENAYFEYDAGFLRPEACIRAQLQLAKKNGADIHTDERVTSFVQERGGVTVTTDRAEYRAEQLVVSAGPWLPQFLNPQLSSFFRVKRQVLYWFDVEPNLAEFEPSKFPIFIWELQAGKQGTYGFPAIDGPHGGMKIATEDYTTTTTPTDVQREVTQEETSAMFENYVKPYFPGVNARCVKSAVCLYTVTPDAGFVVDRLPDAESIIVCSPCSGHGFKHSAAIGESIAQLVLDGRSRLDLSAFGLERALAASQT